jgi:hypothetical protein
VRVSHLPRNRHYRFFEIAAIAAASSDGTGRNHFRLGSVLVYKKIVYSIKCNSEKTHPKLLKFTRYPVLHAESACILARGFDNCYGMTIYTVRLLANNEIAIAKPCISCYNLMKYVGIRQCYYTSYTGYDVLTIN